MFESRLLDIINATRSLETENKYGYEEIAVDLHTEPNIKELEEEFAWL